MTLARGGWMPDGTPGTVLAVAILILLFGILAVGLWTRNRKRN